MKHAKEAAVFLKQFRALTALAEAIVDAEEIEREVNKLKAERMFYEKELAETKAKVARAKEEHTSMDRVVEAAHAKAQSEIDAARTEAAAIVENAARQAETTRALMQEKLADAERRFNYELEHKQRVLAKMQAEHDMLHDKVDAYRRELEALRSRIEG